MWTAMMNFFDMRVEAKAKYSFQMVPYAATVVLKKGS
jgi:hypothetical protein